MPRSTTDDEIDIDTLNQVSGGAGFAATLKKDIGEGISNIAHDASNIAHAVTSTIADHVGGAVAHVTGTPVHAPVFEGPHEALPTHHPVQIPGGAHAGLGPVTIDPVHLPISVGPALPTHEPVGVVVSTGHGQADAPGTGPAHAHPVGVLHQQPVMPHPVMGIADGPDSSAQRAELAKQMAGATVVQAEPTAGSATSGSGKLP